MLAPLQNTPEPAKPAYTPTLRPAQPFFAPAGRRAAAQPFFPPKPAPKPAAQPTPAPAPALLAAVPPALAPAVALLAHTAQQQAPYQLLAHALGHDPLTGRPAPAAPRALARALVGLLPDGPARFQQLQAAGPALAQLPAWLHHQLAAHQLSGPRLTQVLTQTWTQLRALGLRDALDPAPALARLTQPWRALAQDVARFVVRTEAALLRWLVAAVLGPDHAAPVLRALDQGGDLLLRILRHPLPFLTNLVAAGQRGFAAFLANGPRHLLAAGQDWLLGGLAQAGLHLPARLDLAGLLDVLLQVFDLTKAAVLHRLRQRLPTLPTERLQQVLTQVGGVALTLWQHGPQAAWQAISQQADGLRAQALDLVQQQVLAVAAKAVPLLLASLAVPGGAFLQLARGLYNGVMLFVEKGKQLAQVGQALFASAAAIATGQLAPAAQAVENTLVKILPVALNFLGRLLRLDAIPQAIQTGLKKVRVPVEKAVNRVLDTVADKAKAIWSTLKAGAGKVADKSRQVAATVSGKVAGWLGLRERFSVGAEQYTLYFDAKQPDTLFVASTPQSYADFLTEIARHVVPTSPAAAQAYQQAQPLAQKLDASLATQAIGVDITATVAALLKKLVPYTIVLMKERDAQLGHPAAGTYEVVYGGVTSTGGFGRSMTATFSGPAILSQAGSQPKSSLRTAANFADLNERRRGGSRYYVLGHLLSQELGGTGKEWYNLTPLRGADNGAHERKVEQFAKRYKGGPEVVAYTVLPTYGRTVNTSLISALSGDPQAAEKARIITAEQHVPLNLVCMLRVWDPRLPGGSGEPGKLVERKDETIDNRVTQHPDDYQLEKVALAVPINSGLYINLVKAGLRGEEAITVRAAVTLGIARGYAPITEASVLFQLANDLQTQQMGANVKRVLGSVSPTLDKVRFAQLIKNGRLALA